MTAPLERKKNQDIKGRNSRTLTRVFPSPRNSSLAEGQKQPAAKFLLWLDKPSTLTDQRDMATPYIPNRDANFATWAANFSTLLTANPGLYGLIAADATAVAGLQTTWAAAYATAISPSSRTPASIAAKDTAKMTYLATLRPYALRISMNPGVLVANKIAIGVNPRTNGPTPVPAPITYPVISIPSTLIHGAVIRYKDDLAAPTVKAKPNGVKQLQLVCVYNATGTPTVNLDIAPTIALQTKSPFTIQFPASNAAQVANLAARWVTQAGKVGPWGPIVQTVVT